MIEARLLEAQAQAEALFAAITEQQLIRAGRSERAINDDVHRLAAERFGVRSHWHKRIVRAGANTLLPYAENPPDLVVADNDIVFLDLGPVFGQFEADVGRTFVVGKDPEMLRLAADLAPLHAECKAYWHAHPGLTGRDYFAEVCRAVEARGWRYGGPHAGHLVGEFPHENAFTEIPESYIGPGNGLAMDAPDAQGQRRHWILEIHLVHPGGAFGGFLEELLTL